MRGTRKSTGENPFRTGGGNGTTVNSSSSKGESGSVKRSVDLGNPGETPKKFLAFNQTAPPSDIQSILNNRSDVLPSIDEFYPPNADEVNNISIGTSDFGRPKTGRGKAHPSPDEFFDYVVPSPDTGKIKSNRILIHSAGSRRKLSAVGETSGDEASIKTETSVASSVKQSEASSRSRSVSVSSSTRLADNYLLGLNMEGVAKEKQIALLGCWLFGSALKI